MPCRSATALGRGPHAAVNHYKSPRVVRVGGSVLRARAGETTDSRGAAWGRRATLTSHEELEADCELLTGSIQITNYKMRTVSTTSQHDL